MRHLKRGRKLSRTSAHRKALLRNLARALIEHEQISTTVPKAKELRPYIEKLVTLAKKGTLHARRLALAKLDDQQAVKKLFDELAERFAERPGGYTRIIKSSKRRLGDGGHTAFISFLGEDEPISREREEAAAPSAPMVTEDEEEEKVEESSSSEEAQEESQEQEESKEQESEESSASNEEQSSEETEEKKKEDDKPAE